MHNEVMQYQYRLYYIHESSVIVLKTICSLIMQTLFNNCSIFCRGLEAFYIALGHVDPSEIIIIIRRTKNANSTLDQLVQNSYVNMTTLSYCSSRDAIDLVHIEVAVNYVVYCIVLQFSCNADNSPCDPSSSS